MKNNKSSSKVCQWIRPRPNSHWTGDREEEKEDPEEEKRGWRGVSFGGSIGGSTRGPGGQWVGGSRMRKGDGSRLLRRPIRWEQWKTECQRKPLQPCRPQVSLTPGTRQAEGAQSQAPTTAPTSRKRRAARSIQVRGRVRVLDTVVASQGSGSPERQGGADRVGGGGLQLSSKREAGQAAGKRLSL